MIKEGGISIEDMREAEENLLPSQKSATRMRERIKDRLAYFHFKPEDFQDKIIDLSTDIKQEGELIIYSLTGAVHGHKIETVSPFKRVTLSKYAGGRISIDGNLASEDDSSKFATKYMEAVFLWEQFVKSSDESDVKVEEEKIAWNNNEQERKAHELLEEIL